MAGMKGCECETRYECTMKYALIKIKDHFIKDGIYHFVPEKGKFDMIYRAAKGAYWDEKYSSLYFKGKASCEKSLYYANEALKNEYRTMLYC